MNHILTDIRATVKHGFIGRTDRDSLQEWHNPRRRHVRFKPQWYAVTYRLLYPRVTETQAHSTTPVHLVSALSILVRRLRLTT